MLDNQSFPQLNRGRKGNTSDFEQRVAESIQASIAVKQLLLANQESIALLAKVSVQQILKQRSRTASVQQT